MLSGQVNLNQNGTWHGNLQIADASVNISQGMHSFFFDSSIQGNGTLQIQNTAEIILAGDLDIDTFILSTGGVVVNSPSSTTIGFKQFTMYGGSLIGNKAIIDSFTWSGGNIQVNSLAVNDLNVRFPIMSDSF